MIATKILIIGGGNMGVAMAKSILQGADERDSLVVCEHNLNRAHEIEEWGINTVRDYRDIDIGKYDIIILAVKPQDSEDVLRNLQGKILPTTILLSIMAGISAVKIKNYTDHDKIVRLMPNLAILVNKGLTTAYSINILSEKEIIKINHLLQATGEIIWVGDENKIDVSTAISGSGPAYVFYFMNVLYEKAIALGFQESQAKKMVEQTFAGAIELIKTGDGDFSAWIDKVKSKGGTTEAALTEFESKQLKTSIESGVDKAFYRAKELNQKN